MALNIMELCKDLCEIVVLTAVVTSMVIVWVVTLYRLAGGCHRSGATPAPMFKALHRLSEV
jgi:hypothetical protein